MREREEMGWEDDDDDDNNNKKTTNKRKRERRDGMTTTKRGEGWTKTINQQSTNEAEKTMKMTMALNGR